MQTNEYIDNRINTKIREYEDVSKRYNKTHMAMMIAAIACFMVVVILNVIYIIVPVIWLILASIILTLAGIFVFLFDLLNHYEKKALEYQSKANALNYEKNLYKAKESGFKGFAYRCERYMD